MRTCEECIFFERERNGDYKDTLCSHPFIDTWYVDAKQEACRLYFVYNVFICCRMIDRRNDRKIRRRRTGRCRRDHTAGR